MASSPSSLSPHFSFPNNFMMNSSFSDLLTKDDESIKQGLLFNEQVEFGFKSKFKSNSPSSLAMSCPSPSFFNFPSGFLDSPVLLSSNNNYLLPSPTTGAFPDWMGNSNNYQKEIKQEEEKKQITDFSFQPVADTRESESDYKQYTHQPIQTVREQKRSEDGYNWRKYGQKQVKGSENPRSYYKCTYQNCPTKKKVERSLDGKVTDVVYKPSKDSHNHPKPQPSKKSLAAATAASQAIQIQPSVSSSASYLEDSNPGCNSQISSFSTQDNSSVSVDDDELDNTSQKRCNSGTGELDENEPKSKKWKREGENEGLSGYGNSRVVKEPKVVVQTTSDIDILDDGYRWRKYGQKVVKGNPNPRSYYKCTSNGCPVRKHVERAANNLRSVITTYEGKHNHDIPAARGSYRHNNNNNAMSTSNERQIVTASNDQVPYTLQVMQNSENYEYGSYMNQQHNAENTFSKTKDEPIRDDVLLELLY